MAVDEAEPGSSGAAADRQPSAVVRSASLKAPVMYDDICSSRALTTCQNVVDVASRFVIYISFSANERINKPVRIAER